MSIEFKIIEHNKQNDFVCNLRVFGVADDFDGGVLLIHEIIMISIVSELGNGQFVKRTLLVESNHYKKKSYVWTLDTKLSDWSC